MNSQEIENGGARKKFDPNRMMRMKAYMFSFMAIVLLIGIVAGDTGDIVRRIAFSLMFILSLVGAVLATYMAVTSESERKLDRSKPLFRCKYCDTEFNAEGLMKKHQKSCVEMKI